MEGLIKGMTTKNMKAPKGNKAKERPYFSTGIAKLEKLFEQHREDHKILSTLHAELEHRSTHRAVKLRSRVTQTLDTLTMGVAQNSASRVPRKTPPPQAVEGQGTSVPNPAPETTGISPDAYKINPDTDSPNAPDDDFWETPITSETEYGGTDEEPEITNTPASIIDAWTALEVLSPQTYNKPEDLADGDRRRIANINSGLPWEGQGEKARPKTRLFYHVVLGAVKLDLATATLLKAFGDPRPERPRSKAHAALAIVTVDQKGRPAGDNPVAVSSFGFGYHQVRKGKLETLGTWPTVEKRLTTKLCSQLVVFDEDEIQPLTRQQIESASEWLANGYDIPEDQRVRPDFAVRVYQWFAAPKPPEPTLLNSFFLEDLDKIQSLISSGESGKGLRRYLSIDKPPDQVDLLANQEELRALLSPAKMPKARWPAPGQHSLVLLQQTAINLAFAELDESGIAAVNGPPGTGKTTLLRDAVAGIVHARAQAMCEFSDPETAFSHRHKVRRGNAFLHLYQIDESLGIPGTLYLIAEFRELK